MTQENEKFYDIEIVVEGYPPFYITKKMQLTENKKERAVFQELIKDKVIGDLPNTKLFVKRFILDNSNHGEVNVVEEKVGRLGINISNADLNLFTDRLDMRGGHTVGIIPLTLEQKINELQEKINEKRQRMDETIREIEDLEEEHDEAERSLKNLQEELDGLRKEVAK